MLWGTQATHRKSEYWPGFGILDAYLPLRIETSIALCSAGSEFHHGNLCITSLVTSYLLHQATGPLTQAMGPPRSGAGVGVGVLRGAGGSLT